MSPEHGGKDPRARVFLDVLNGFCNEEDFPFGYRRAYPDTGSFRHWVHSINRAEDIWMVHAEANSSISADEDSGNAPRIAIRQGSEVRTSTSNPNA